MHKLSKYSGDVKVKFTTTYTYFDQKIEVVCRRILSQPYAEIIKLKQYDLVQNYPYGCYLACNILWVLVDHILMPMNVCDHCILARFDIKRTILFVYNSLRSGFDDAKVNCDLQRMAVVLSYLLLLPDFYDKCSKVDLQSQYYINKARDEPLDVFLVDELPQ